MVTADAIRLSPEHAKSADLLGMLAALICDGDLTRTADLFEGYSRHIASRSEALLSSRPSRTGADEILAVAVATAFFVARSEESIAHRRTVAQGRP